MAFRSIVHLDADAFFASVEQAADARLRGKPIAVGGEKRGIIASASYEARKFGIYTPMPSVMARRLCPKLILLPGDFEKYELFSRLMFSYAYDFTPDIEIGSIDEGYFDLTGTRKPAVGIAETIRRAIRQALKLSVSEGIAANKLVSQIASKLKKPAAFQFVPRGGEIEFLSPLPNKWLPGVGPKTANQLNAAGLAHIGQIARTPAELLGLLVGSQAPQLHNFARGIDERPVIPVRTPAKSYGEQETFAADSTDEEFLDATLRRMADKLMAKVRDDGKSIRTLTVKVRYNDMDEDQAGESLPEPTDLETDIYSRVSQLLRKAWQRRVSLRLVSLKLSNVYDGLPPSALVLDASARQHESQQRLAGVVDALRQKYGRAVLLRGHDFVLRDKQEQGEKENPKAETRRPKEGRNPKPEIRRDTPSQPTSAPPLINTPLQRGGIAPVENLNRFSGFPPAVTRSDTLKTAKAVENSCAPPATPLKRGVNESGRNGEPPRNSRSESRSEYGLAIVQRQRIGNSFARNAPSSELPNPPADTQHATRNTQHAGPYTHPASRVTPFVPLHVHSYYSFLDSTLSINAIIALAKHYELPTIALTDKNNIHGAVEFAQAALQAGIKPIIGAELNWHGHRLCLYVQNQTGYANLCRILSQDARQGNPKPEIRNPKEGRNPKSEDREAIARFGPAWRKGNPIPLTPALSQREREQLSSALQHSALQHSALQHPALKLFDTPSFADQLPAILPLPLGEGRGEGDSTCKSLPHTNLRPSDFGLPSAFGFRPSDFTFSTDGLIAVSSASDLAPFFPDRFYLENNAPDAFHHSSTNPSIHQSTNPFPHSALRTPHSALPQVASFPIHYALPSDRWKYDVVQSIRTLTLLRQRHPHKRLDGAYHFRTPAEMRQLFSAHPEFLAHSLEIADRCSFAFSFGKPQFPSYPTPDGSPPATFLRRLVMDGLQRRYPEEHTRLKPQLEQELAIITEVGYEEYFLVMWDILQECRRQGIDWITRGSAADSLACYCLEISNVCPIRFDLYFRRFLNKERMALNKLPDIDVDFPHDRKDDVIDLIFKKYGPEHTAIVGGFSTFQSRSAFAEVAKVLGVSEFQVRRITERLPHFSRASELAEVVGETLECSDLPLKEEPYSSALQMARFLDGFPRYPKMHPCGLVLSRQPMHEITPCFTSAKGYPTTHFDMDSVEAVGLVKMDILAQGGLAVMRDVMEAVQSKLSSTPDSADQQPGILPLPLGEGRGEGDSNCKDSTHANPAVVPRPSDFGLPSAFGFRISDFPSPAGPFNDSAIWQLISSGNARAVHHIESPAMLSLCKMCNVHDIDTLIAIVSVIRPGAANENKKTEFTRRYQGLPRSAAVLSRSTPDGPETRDKFQRAHPTVAAAAEDSRAPWRYPHPSLEPCLRSTYGLVVYEEHILQICEAFAGLPPGRADILRRALGKERTDVIAQIQTEFADCARKRGRTETEIAEVWELVGGFRGYAFCKAHSTAYGVEAYQSAWLKLHYPAHFMAAVLTNGKGFYSPLVYILECHRLGIPLLPPFVNEPGPQFEVRRAKGEDRKKSEIRNSKSETNSNGENSKARNSEFRLRDESTIPLTPALSQREREQLSPSSEHFSGLGFADPQSRILPLPLGEGRGEGGRTIPERTRLASEPRISDFAIRIPLLQVKGLTRRTADTILRERARGPFSSLADFFLRVQPLPEEMESLIRVGAFDPFGQSRTAQYWEFRKLETGNRRENPKAETRNPKPEIRSSNSEAQDLRLVNSSRSSSISSDFGLRTSFGFRPSDFGLTHAAHQLELLTPVASDRLPSVPLTEPTRLERLRAEEELLGYPASGHPLELFPDIAWDTYCPVNRLGEHIGEQVVACGLVIEQRLFHQVTGEPMKFLTLADWTGIVETELFAKTYRSYGLSTIRYRVLEVTATVEPFENSRGFTLRVLRAGKPRTQKIVQR